MTTRNIVTKLGKWTLAEDDIFQSREAGEDLSPAGGVGWSIRVERHGEEVLLTLSVGPTAKRSVSIPTEAWDFLAKA